MIVIACQYGGPDHEFPDDWIFGGYDNQHPGADPRYFPTHYQYIDEELGFCYMTGAYLCDDEALDKFTLVAEQTNPKYIAVQRPGDDKFHLMPFEYHIDDDTVYPRVLKGE